MKLRTNLLWMLLALFISIIENEHLYLNAAFHIPYIFVTLLQFKKTGIFRKNSQKRISYSMEDILFQHPSGKFKKLY